MKREKLKFKKGEKVVMIPNDNRLSVVNLTVKSIGSKYITCSDNYRDYKFETDTLNRVDWGTYYLWHSLEEFEKVRELNDFTNTIESLTFEELKLFKKIHDVGLENIEIIWKK